MVLGPRGSVVTVQLYNHSAMVLGPRGSVVTVQLYNHSAMVLGPHGSVVTVQLYNHSAMVFRGSVVTTHVYHCNTRGLLSC